MKKKLFAMMIALATATAHAAEIEGVKLVDRVSLTPGGAQLVLNGAGKRTRFFFDVYVAGLYLAEKKNTAADAIALAGPKRVSMTLLRDLTAKQLVDALNEGMEANNTPAELEVLKSQITELAAIMSAIGQAKKGDVVALDFLPESGTHVLVNGVERGQNLPGADLYRALLRVWLGDKPVQDNLKKALLGQP